MKVHPAPRKRNITLRYDNPSPATGKKLRRLPHIFAKVLELPFHSDADVSVEETGEFFRFTVFDTDVGADVRVHTLEIHPGVTKIVVRCDDDDVLDVSMTELQLDLWRFRLPDSTRPDLAVARYEDGDLIVVVPKDEEEERENQREVWGDQGNNLVLVQ